MEKVSCSWNDEELKFILEPQLLAREEVQRSILEVLAAQSKDLCSVFFFPMTPGYVKQKFGETAKQIDSGQ